MVLGYLSSLYWGKRSSAAPYSLDDDTVIWLSIKAGKQEPLGYSVFYVFYVQPTPQHVQVLLQSLNQSQLKECEQAGEQALMTALERFESYLLALIAREVTS
ncbi:NDNF family protein [Vibrio agarivorans]|uniref:NDNF family protein n=1 Tax=Vibrio agarivorans TaxID=153622 RepID=UPI00222F1BF5|nr:NDNF family protein [Vibrio agarivorans]